MIRIWVIAILALPLGVSCSSLQTTQRMETAAGTHSPMQLEYLLHVPRSRAPERGWPFVLFLHGAGERGSDIQKVKTHGPPAILGENKTLRGCVVVSPQCPEDWWWDSVTLRQLIAEVIANHPVDRSRLYVTGLSMGGYGTWHLLATYPELFAAGIPICGGGDPNRYKERDDPRWVPFVFPEGRVSLLGGVPIWAFHGAKDQTVPEMESARLVRRLRSLGNPVRYTVYPEAGHDSWTETYRNPSVYAWLLSQRK